MSKPRALKTVLHLRSASFIGGPERQIITLLSGTHAYRHIIASFAVNSHGNRFLEYAKEAGIDTLCLNVRSSFDPTCIFQLYRYLKDSKIDLICTHDYRANSIGFMSRRTLPVKQAAFFRGWTGENKKVALYERLDHAIVRRVDRVVAVSPLKARELEKLGICRHPISVVHNSINLDPLQTLRMRDIREEWNIPIDAKIIGSVGRLSVEKGHRFLIEAVPEILKKHGDVYCLLVGDGSQKDHLVELARALGIDGRVIFTGWQEDPLSYIHSMDVFVLPSLTEGLPNVLLEAAALGKAVVTTNVGGCGDIILSGRNGVVIQPGNVQDIASGTLDLLGNPALADQYGKSAARYVRERFSVETAVARYEEMVEELLATGD